MLFSFMQKFVVNDTQLHHSQKQTIKQNTIAFLATNKLVKNYQPG